MSHVVPQLAALDAEPFADPEEDDGCAFTMSKSEHRPCVRMHLNALHTPCSPRVNRRPNAFGALNEYLRWTLPFPLINSVHIWRMCLRSDRTRCSTSFSFGCLAPLFGLPSAFYFARSR